MGLPGAILGLLAAAAVLLPRGGFADSSRHSLRYSCQKVSEPSRELPQFLTVICLDDEPIEPIARSDSLNSTMAPLVPWMNAEQAEIFMDFERRFKAALEKLSNLNPQTGGRHTWQVMWGCELREDGSKGGFLRYSYDGMDFINFDKETLRWVAAQPQAQKVKEKWEEDPRRFQGSKVFLEQTCIQRLQTCLSYKNKTLEKIAAGGLIPVGIGVPVIVSVAVILILNPALAF